MSYKHAFVKFASVCIIIFYAKDYIGVLQRAIVLQFLKIYHANLCLVYTVHGMSLGEAWSSMYQ